MLPLICNIHRSLLVHNGSSTPSQLFLLLTRLGFDCFPVLRRVSLPIHAYGPASSAQVSLLSVPRTLGVHCRPMPRAWHRRPRIKRSPSPEPGARGHARVRLYHLCRRAPGSGEGRSEEHTSELQSHLNLVCRLLLEKKN